MFSQLKDVRLENSGTGDWTTCSGMITEQKNKGR